VSYAAEFRAHRLALLDAEGERTTTLEAPTTVYQSSENNIPEELTFWHRNFFKFFLAHSVCKM
jgi:hypothetical protein